ncbi:MAG: hypothetical protein ACFE95_03565 [Candidatus Hodarchaeota archaeon]
MECINGASQDMHKARIRFASTSVPGLMRNTRDQDPQYAVTYPDLEVMKVEDRRGETIATMINYAGHPEVLWSDNLELTSDYVGYLCDEVEEELGGVAIFINGAIGGMVTPDSDGVFDGQYTPGVPSQHTFEMAETIGTILAEETINALADAKKSPPKMEFNVERKTLTVPLENMGFYFLMTMGILERPEPWYSPSISLFGSIMTEVNVINIGEAQMVTMPGEVLPSIGHRLKEVMTGKYNFQIGMGNDELGYIIPKEEWDYSGYWTMTPYGPVWEGKYEESMAIGDDIGEVMENTLLEMLNGT